MNIAKDRLLIIGGGAVVALLIGLILAIALRDRAKPSTKPADGAGPAGLMVESSEPAKLSAAEPLRCFVNGQMVGNVTLAECAQRNGVAAGALDVGIDANGQLGAGVNSGQALTPLPPATGEPTAAAPAAEAAGANPEATPASTPSAATPIQAPAVQKQSAVATCWRYDNNSWSRLPGDQALGACVQTLYAGRCQKAGGALYGRWGDETLRLVPGQVQISADNRSFRTLANQSADCALAPIATQG